MNCPFLEKPTQLSCKWLYHEQWGAFVNIFTIKNRISNQNLRFLPACWRISNVSQGHGSKFEGTRGYMCSEIRKSQIIESYYITMYYIFRIPTDFITTILSSRIPTDFKLKLLFYHFTIIEAIVCTVIIRSEQHIFQLSINYWKTSQFIYLQTLIL
jgi:hypothetical protein